MFPSRRAYVKKQQFNDFSSASSRSSVVDPYRSTKKSLIQCTMNADSSSSKVVVPPSKVSTSSPEAEARARSSNVAKAGNR